MDAPSTGPLLRALRMLLEGALSLVILLDEVLRPLYRPLLRAVASLQIVRRAETLIGRQSRLAILILLAVPFAVAEPLKLLALYLLATGRFWSGGVLLALAHLASFLLVERIYHAGRNKLRTYAWFAWAMDRLTGLRDTVLARLRASAAYRSASHIAKRIRRWWRLRIRRRL